MLLGLVFIFVIGGTFAIPQIGSAAEISDDSLEQATQLIVMIEGELGEAPTFGAGIIFGLHENQINIATANHVVRRGAREAKKLRVKFKKYPDTFFSAELLEHFDSELDVAVIRSTGLGKKGIDLADLEMNVLGKGSFIDRGDGVYPVGNPNGVPWGMPVVPDRIAQIVGKGITFQSAFISSGHSGGGLVEESGVLIGMIIKDQPPFGLAVKIDEIVSTLTNWGYLLSLNESPVYRIDGMWESDGLFSSLKLQVKDDKLSGEVFVSHPYGIQNGFLVIGKATTSILGNIKGNQISFQARGNWTKRNFDYPQKGFPMEVIHFLVSFQGRANKGQLLLSYEFEYPNFRESSKGEFTAKRADDQAP